MRAETLYAKAPVAIQNLLVSLAGWKMHRLRYGSRDHRDAAERLARNETLSAGSLEQLQLEELRRLVHHCYRSSPYYRSRFDDVGLRPDDVRQLSDLSLVPITPKEDLRARTAEFYTREIGRDLVELHTSGTTGSPLTVYVSKEDIAFRFALLERCRRWAGVHVGQRRASFTGRTIVPESQSGPPFWRFNHPARQLLLSAYHLSSENLPHYVEAVVGFRPEIVDGYPSAVHIFAEHVLRTGDERLRPRAAMLTAETVLSRQRETIEKAFACKVYNQYSSQEGAPYISECRDGSLHVHPDSGICEIVDERGAPAAAGEAGNLVVTSFMASVTPLLRFSTEDLAVPAAPGTRCSCGSSFPVVEAVVGRVDDILHTPDRGFVGRLDPVFKKLPSSVIEAQIVQTAPDRIVARLVPDRSRYERHHADLLVEEMRKRLGRVVHIEVEEVDHLPRGARGKLRPVVNLCSDRLPQSLRYRAPSA